MEERARDIHAIGAATEETKSLLEEATWLYRKAKNWEQAAKLLLRLGQQDEAIQVCRQSRDYAASVHVATVLHQQGQSEEAIKLLIECGCVSKAIQ